MKGWRRRSLAAAALALGLVAARPAHAAYLDDAGWGALTVLANVAYMPAKLVYAALGGLTGGMALGVTGGDMNTAETVWVTSMGGTYVLTPRMLQGLDPVSFAGTTEPAPAIDNSGDTGDTHAFGEQPLNGG
jgi:hypothetical protein